MADINTLIKGAYRQNILIGSKVQIITKADQRTGNLTTGRVKRFLTKKPKHTRGIKVQLDTGEIGRVQDIMESDNFYLLENEDFDALTIVESIVFDSLIYELAKPKLKDGEFAVPLIDKHKIRKINPKSNRMKKFKTTKWMKTTIKPEDRTFKNLPKYSTGKSKVRWNDWLGVSGNPGKGYDGKWYSYSHRAVHGFGIGDVIKPGTIGNKYQYDNKKIDKATKGMDYRERDNYIDSIKFEPYTIQTDEEAKEHSERFRKNVA